MEPSPPPSPRRATSPELSVGLELARALGGLALLPLRVADFLFCREALAGELAGDLEAPSPSPWVAREAPVLPERALRVFVSCAETSGEIHAANVSRALVARARELGAPAPELFGLGGERLRAAGVRTLADPVSRATMGLSGALRGLPFYLELLRGSARELGRADLAVLVDSPALHVPLGRIARRAGARTVHFVTPQYWGWAPWRAAGYRRAVDRALSILPFEPPWFARRGIEALHVGHPLLDSLPPAPSPDAPTRRGLVLLAGSRRSVIALNLPWMLGVVARLRERLGELEVVLPHSDAALTPLLEEHVRAAGAQSWARVESGDLHASLGRAQAAFSVSGTVLIDLLHQRLPTVVVYRLGSALSAQLSRQLVLSPWFASPNLLAGREVLPEFAFHGAGDARAVGDALERALSDPAWRSRCRRGLEQAAQRLGGPGACARAAEALLQLAPKGP